MTYRLALLSLLAVIGLGLGTAGLFAWAEYHLREARRQADQFEFGRASEHFDKALFVWRHSAPLQLEAGRAARRGEAYHAAEQHLDTCQRIQRGVSEPLQLERLMLRSEIGDVADVEKSLWPCVTEDRPETPLILEALCLGYLRQMRYSAALKAANMTLEREPNHPLVLFWRGWIREHTEHPREAIADYRRVLEVAPGRDDARLRLAGLLITEEPREALGHLRVVRSHKPDDAEVLVTLARCHKALGEPAEAQQLLDQVLAARPDYAPALFQRGVLFVEQGEAAQGESWLRRAIDLEPSNREYHYQLYQCLLQQPGRSEDAERQAGRLKQVTEDLTRLHDLLMSGKMDRARIDARVSGDIGEIMLRAGDEARGVQWLEQAVRIDSDYQPARKALAEYYEKKGKTEEARQHRARIRK